MSDNNNKTSGPIKHGTFHKKPRSRREFIGQGYVAGVSSIVAPSFLSLVTQRAYGLECSPEAGAKKAVPFISLDLAGGPNIAGGNVMVGKGSGGSQTDFLSAGGYATLGLATAVNDASLVSLNGTEESLMFHSSSQFLAGFRTKAVATTTANMDGVIFCTASIDDTGANPHNPAYWINKAGLTGALVQLVGTRNSDSGGNAAAPAGSINPAIRPVLMTTPDSTTSLVDLGLLGSLLNPAKAEKVLKAISSMSQTQVARFSDKELPAKLKDLVNCGYINSAALISQFGPAALDPRQDPAFAAGTAFNNNFAGTNAASSAVAKLVLDGLAGAGTIQMGGYDYHGQGVATQNQKDFDAGVQAGQLFQTAALKKSPLIMYWFSDGAVAAQASNDTNGRYPFVSDNGERSAAVMLVYDPNGKPKIRNSRRQVGFFNDSGAVEATASLISSSVESLTKLIVANYLALSGKEGDLAKIVGDDPFGKALESLLSLSPDTFNKPA